MSSIICEMKRNSFSDLDNRKRLFKLADNNNMEGASAGDGLPHHQPLSTLPARSREKRPEANHYFYDPALFPHLDVLTRHADLILGELRAALGSGIVSADSRNGAELSGVWCEDKQFDDFYQRTKNQQVHLPPPPSRLPSLVVELIVRLGRCTWWSVVQGWLHWWSVNNPDRPNSDWTIFGLMNNGKYMTENCAVPLSPPMDSLCVCVPFRLLWSFLCGVAALLTLSLCVCAG
jgi:hypothetical protein